MARHDRTDLHKDYRRERRNPLDPNQRPAGRRRTRSAREMTEGCLKSRLCPLFVFLIILGAAFGVIFGFIPIDNIKNFLGMEVSPFGGENDGNGDNVEASDAPTSAPTPGFVFMQCPANGECCNGLQSNCDLTPGEMMWPTVHNAMHDDRIGNNRAPLEDALAAGYRGLQLDVCLCEQKLIFCHGLCNIGVKTFDEVFPNINTFLNENPSETIMINFELSVGTPTPQSIWSQISTYGGLRAKAYIHQGGDLPTMRELQASNRRLLLFKHNGADCTNFNSNGCSNRIAEYHKYAVETEFKFSNEDAISTYQSSCPGSRGTSGRKDFYHINHFVTKTWGPSQEAAKTINLRESLEERIIQCEKIAKAVTTVVAIDFWQQGDLLKVSQEINIERAKRRRSLRSRLRRRISNWMVHH